jgi:ubiquinone/menaquinone biosynthesis C-methylase UbiE
MTDHHGIWTLYRHIAPLYDQYVTPVFSHLARDLAAWIIRCVDASLRFELHDPFDLDDATVIDAHQLRSISAVDIGTGTGILARSLVKTIHTVVGIDLSPDMLKAAKAVPGLSLMVDDLHQLALKRGAVQLVVSSFGLNAATPKQAFRSLERVLQPGGLLIFQEWAVEDDYTRIVNEAVKKYAPDDIPGMDNALQQFYAHPKVWYDHLQDTEDFYDMLKQAGFQLVWVKESPFVTVNLPSIEVFLNSKLAWPARWLTMQAMTSETRNAFKAELQDRLSQFANPDGSLDWTPPLFRVCAMR